MCLVDTFILILNRLRCQGSNARTDRLSVCTTRLRNHLNCFLVTVETTENTLIYGHTEE